MGRRRNRSSRQKNLCLGVTSPGRSKAPLDLRLIMSKKLAGGLTLWCGCEDGSGAFMKKMEDAESGGLAR